MPVTTRRSRHPAPGRRTSTRRHTPGIKWRPSISWGLASPPIRRPSPPPGARTRRQRSRRSRFGSCPPPALPPPPPKQGGGEKKRGSRGGKMALARAIIYLTHLVLVSRERSVRVEENEIRE